MSPKKWGHGQSPIRPRSGPPLPPSVMDFYIGKILGWGDDAPVHGRENLQNF